MTYDFGIFIMLLMISLNLSFLIHAVTKIASALKELKPQPRPSSPGG